MRTRAGFTLLEVLAAAAVVGAAFTVVAKANIQGLRAEGTAGRRLEASLLADRVLSELEVQLMIGTAPQVGRDERDMEGFNVLVEVAPLAIVLADLPPELAESAALSDNRAGPTLLAKESSGAVTPLRHVHIAVGWTEGASEQQVVRDTFVFDAASVSSYLEGISTEDAGAPDGGDEDDSGEDSDSDEDAG
jgi:prepilin-type N-terminal cleavage/methylation domain-containing protein